MKNILVLIDLSPRSEQIARLALKIARQTGANVVLCDILKQQNKAFIYEEYDFWSFEDMHYPSVEALVEELKENPGFTLGEPEIGCARLAGLETHKITDVIAENDAWMVVMGINDLQELGIYGPDNYTRQIIDHSVCPVLLIPDSTDVTAFDKMAYITDLRYCDLNVISFLKEFNAHIFVTHVSASGMPDMEDGYAQEFLSDEVATKIKYNKLFLRNIKGNNRKTDLELIVRTAGVKMVAIVNKKHQMLDRYIQADTNKKRAYHQLPLLVIPYMNGRF
jgi:nucleotide-binding universal stress UspA family protein